MPAMHRFISSEPKNSFPFLESSVSFVWMAARLAGWQALVVGGVCVGGGGRDVKKKEMKSRYQSALMFMFLELIGVPCH